MSSDDALAEARDWCRSQMVCQHPRCEKPRAPWEVHHVVYEQELKHHDVPKWDWRNCMRLCKRCHKILHHQRIDPVPFEALSHHAIEYARELLGDYAIDYLERRYPRGN